MIQAEDGIRDRNVTGVQTCALPISTGRRLRHAHRAAAALRGARSTASRGMLFDLITPGGAGNPHPTDLARRFPERAEQVRAILAKAAQPRFETQIRYGVATRHPDRVA